jgi:hypothetical protein
MCTETDLVPVLTRRTVLVLAARGLIIAAMSAIASSCGLPTTATEAPSSQSAHATLQPRGAAPTPPSVPSAAKGGDLVAVPALAAVLEALRNHVLVGLCDRHGLQQEHDFIRTLLQDPALPDLIDDLVVEFGNPRLQSLADRYILATEPIPMPQVREIWRQTGGTLWDAPVYERFFLTVRTVNESLAPDKRIRVLLGDTPIDFGRVQSAADADYVRTLENETDAHFADVVEREVLAKGRRALLLAGGGHLRRGLHADQRPRADAPGQPPNAGTAIVLRHPGTLFVIDTLIVGDIDRAIRTRVEDNVRDWRPLALAPLAATWLGDQKGPSISYRALTPADARYAAQVDAVIYLGPDASLTRSLPDPAIYDDSEYRAFLARLGAIMSAVYGDTEDWLGDAIAAARGSSHFFP